MDLAQVQLAESFPGLIGNYCLFPRGTEDPVTGEIEYSQSQESDDFEYTQRKWHVVQGEYRRTEFHKALLTLQDTMNTSIDTGVRVGGIRMAEDAITSVAGEPITLPISIEKAEMLYNKLDPSLVGVENRGDVLDTALRRSHETPAESLAVSRQLASFDYPEELMEIHKKICPSAVSIRAELYKLVIYGEGDFFVPHRDSMSSPDMFGSISVQIPVARQSKEGSNSKRGRESPSKSKSEHCDTKGHGQLVFYVGRHASDAEIPTSSDEDLSFGLDRHLAYAVDMEKLGNATMEGGAIVVPYGAWTGDVLHEVRRIKSGYRAVLIYRLYKEGHRNSYIPRALRETTLSQLSRLMHLLGQSTHGIDDPLLPEPFRYVGVILRHAYPPAGLDWRYLKGIDAVLYNIASETNRCLLFNAYAANECRYTWKHEIYRESITRHVFLTAGDQIVNYDDGLCFLRMAQSYKMFVGAIWMQLGFGTLSGGGFCYGSMEYGPRWWFRSAVMIITPEPSKWKRCRSLLLAVKKGSKGIGRVGDNVQLVETIASFL